MHLKAATIKLYIAGIRYNYIKLGRRNPFLNMDRLPYILDTLVKAMITTAFYGFMRCGEFTVKPENPGQGIILMKDITVSADNSHYQVFLRHSKTDQENKGVRVTIFKNSTKTCPMDAMLTLRNFRLAAGASRLDCLFADSLQQPITRDKFIGYLKHLVSILGLNSSRYSGHSFRIGAATTAARVGVQDHLIQTLGRWTSNCYTWYIRTAKKHYKRYSKPNVIINRVHPGNDIIITWHIFGALYPLY